MGSAKLQKRIGDFHNSNFPDCCTRSSQESRSVTATATSPGGRQAEFYHLQTGLLLLFTRFPNWIMSQGPFRTGRGQKESGHEFHRLSEALFIITKGKVLRSTPWSFQQTLKTCFLQYFKLKKEYSVNVTINSGVPANTANSSVLEIVKIRK